MANTELNHEDTKGTKDGSPSGGPEPVGQKEYWDIPRRLPSGEIYYGPSHAVLPGEILLSDECNRLGIAHRLPSDIPELHTVFSGKPNEGSDVRHGVDGFQPESDGQGKIYPPHAVLRKPKLGSPSGGIKNHGEHGGPEVRSRTGGPEPRNEEQNYGVESMKVEVGERVWLLDFDCTGTIVRERFINDEVGFDVLVRGKECYVGSLRAEKLNYLNMEEENVRRLIIATVEEKLDLLLEKNRKYGNSALQPRRIMSKANAVEQILVRIDDKLNRIQNMGVDAVDGEDSVLDAEGYFSLLRLGKRIEKARRKVADMSDWEDNHEGAKGTKEESNHGEHGGVEEFKLRSQVDMSLHDNIYKNTRRYKY